MTRIERILTGFRLEIRVNPFDPYPSVVNFVTQFICLTEQEIILRPPMPPARP